VSADTTTLLHALWSGATIVSIDVETCTADDGDHIVSVGAVKVHEDKTVGTFTSLVNPGGPVNNTWIHGITAADVAAAPDFAGIEPALTSFITPAPGERLILAAHNAGFDISRLRLEYERCGQELPNLPLLDTMRLAPLLGVTLRGPSLTLLLKTLNLVNANPHEALADATACSDALRRLLREAAKQGRSSLTDLLNDAGTRARKVTDVDAAPRVRTAERVGSRTHIPGEHLAGHAVTLPAKPLKKDVKGGWSTPLSASSSSALSSTRRPRSQQCTPPGFFCTPRGSSPPSSASSVSLTGTAPARTQRSFLPASSSPRAAPQPTS
jgi:DNA polymerase III epsilon subunit-like protein